MWVGRLLLWREPTGRRWDEYDETGVVEAELFVDVFYFGADLDGKENEPGCRANVGGLTRSAALADAPNGK